MLEDFAGLGVYGSYADAGEWPPDAAALVSALVEAGHFQVGYAYGHDGAAFGCAVTFERLDAELFAECVADPAGELFGSADDEFEALQLFAAAAAYETLEERGCGNEELGLVLADKLADGLGFERGWMEHGVDAADEGRPEGGGEPK